MIANLFLVWLGSAQPAVACGGFFCSSGGTTTTTTTTTQTGDYGIVPVVQDAERILFRDNGDGTLTTFVEVAFEQREDVEFAWIIPIPEVIPVEEISTIDASLFNALELATAPRFTFQWTETTVNQNPGYTYNYNFRDRREPYGCGCGVVWGCTNGHKAAGSGSWVADSGAGSTTIQTTLVQEEIGVAVVEEAVVGPFAIEVITAVDAPEFAVWLDANGYDLPDGAIAPLEHYIGLGHAFLGVKLAPDVPNGPVETLVFTCPAARPTIPLILTAIASADDLWITTWILGNDAYVPSNWNMVDYVADETLPTGGGNTDYLERVAAATSVFGGQGFVLEYAGATETLDLPDLIADATVKQFPRLTRYRGHIAPWQMTLDPEFGPFPGLPDYANDHFVAVDTPPPAGQPQARQVAPLRRMDLAWLFAGPLAALVGWSRRRRAA